MRDPRFVAAHRGGLLNLDGHRFLANWAADCAENVQPFFTKCSENSRPNEALETARLWASEAVRTGVAMKASVAAHAAARQVTDNAAIAAARAAGQAVATAHFADHCVGSLLYSLKVLAISGDDSSAELASQLAKLPENLRPLVSFGVRLRLAAMKIEVST